MNRSIQSGPAFLRAMAALLLLLGAGCAGGGNRLQLTAQNGAPFSQQFAHAYITQGEDGEYQIVMVDEPGSQVSGQEEKALAPVEAMPLRQIVVIRVLWQPLRGVKPDHVAATNASIDWYVTGAGSRRDQDLLHYQGAGYVRVFGDGNSVSATIRNATLKATETRGGLVDPIGAASLHGSVHATVAPQRVRAAMEELQALTAGASQGVSGEPSGVRLARNQDLSLEGSVGRAAAGH